MYGLILADRMVSNDADILTFDEYTEWYYNKFLVELMDGSVEDWYDDATADGIRKLEASDFWKTLQKSLDIWNETFRAEHDNYPLLWDPQGSAEILIKPFNSVLEKSFRWNMPGNCNWPNPPIHKGEPGTGQEDDDRAPDDPKWWYGPHNWLEAFPDIFRTRLTAAYFDGVRYITSRVEELAKRTTSDHPKPKFHASDDGYYAAHVGIHHEMELRDYENGDPTLYSVDLEVQVTTTIQATINRILHRVYEEWRLNGRPDNWQWEYDKPEFSVNYLGSTLHYLEGMIVMARDHKETG